LHASALGYGLGFLLQASHPGASMARPVATTQTTAIDVMGLMYVLLVDTEVGTTTVQMEANSKEEALESGQELYPGCRLALVNPEPGENKG
jgi:hypothetical protein